MLCMTSYHALSVLDNKHADLHATTLEDIQHFGVVKLFALKPCESSYSVSSVHTADIRDV